MSKTVLFVSHKEKQCGVHEFGKNIANALSKSQKYNFVYVECSGMSELDNAIAVHQPVAIIYNYHIPTMPWIHQKLIHKLYRPLNAHIDVPQIGIMHEVTQEKADKADAYLFDYHIAPDPTLLLRNPLVFKTGRLVPDFENHFPLSLIPVVGSFGFATPNKGFEQIVHVVNEEFENAVIRFNIPSADFGDRDGNKAKELEDNCRKLITKTGITLEVSNDFLSKEGILTFLAQNSINVFLYQDKSGRGISSAADYALAVDRPIAVSDSSMFRNLHDVEPSILVPGKPISDIMNQGIAPLEKLKTEWSSENIVWEYERIIGRILNEKRILSRGLVQKSAILLRRFLGKSKTFSWLGKTNVPTEDKLSKAELEYVPVKIPVGVSINRILDDSARLLYAKAVRIIEQLVPLTMAKKIHEANVQQAFVLDTILRYVKEYPNAKILCVGSYEDTAAMSIKRLGYKIEEIDPVLNYYLQEYFSKPGVVKESYDIIFSTSVIEHDPDDESFIRCIAGLLAPNGVAILTCDYNDQWKPGDFKPDVDIRLYTQNDLKTRLLPLMKNCTLVDIPQWDCLNPDFLYLNKYRYTFATLVTRKSPYTI